nr:ARF guanine-nucleotide exchange factor GNL1-like isoform X2 [Ipomoea batatas]
MSYRELYNCAEGIAMHSSLELRSSVDVRRKFGSVIMSEAVDYSISQNLVAMAMIVAVCSYNDSGSELGVERLMVLACYSMTSCRFEVTDSASEEWPDEILQVLWLALKSKCQSELFQEEARLTMHELLVHIFLTCLIVESKKMVWLKESDHDGTLRYLNRTMAPFDEGSVNCRRCLQMRSSVYPLWKPGLKKVGQKDEAIKRKLLIGADHFNKDPKKGLEFVQARIAIDYLLNWMPCLEPLLCAKVLDWSSSQIQTKLHSLYSVPMPGDMNPLTFDRHLFAMIVRVPQLLPSAVIFDNVEQEDDYEAPVFCMASLAVAKISATYNFDGSVG